MTEIKCDRCGKKITGTQHGMGRVSLKVNDGNHESWMNPVRFEYCYTCTEKIEKFLKIKQKNRS